MKICPKCGRQYPSTMKSCLECGSPLIDKAQTGIKKQDIAKHAGKLAILAAAGIFLLFTWFVLLPVINYAMISGQDFSAIVKADAAEQSAEIPHIPPGQVVSNSVVEAGVTKIREGSNVLNADRLYFVTVSLKNLNAGGHVIVSGSDFILVDSNGTSYYTYGIGDKIAQDLAPLESRSFELNFEIPRNAEGLVLHYYFPRTDVNTASSTPVVFTLPGST